MIVSYYNTRLTKMQVFFECFLLLFFKIFLFENNGNPSPNALSCFSCAVFVQLIQITNNAFGINGRHFFGIIAGIRFTVLYGIRPK